MRARRPDRFVRSLRIHARQGGIPASLRQVAALLAAALLAGGCALLRRQVQPPPPRPVVVASEPVPVDGLGPEVALDTLAVSLAARADTLPVEALPGLEAEIRDWLARLEYQDPALVPMDVAADPWFRRWRGRLLDALGVASRRQGNLREAEAALRSAAAEIHSRGTTTGYAAHFLHLGDVLAERGRWREAAEAYLAAEVRGLGADATPSLEAAWRRTRGSPAGLERARAEERARVEDERVQEVLVSGIREPVPPFSWPRRTGPPMTPADLAGHATVIAVWGPGCCPRWRASLGALSERLAVRGAAVIGVWLGADPAGAGPPAAFPIAVPVDPARERRRLRIGRLPTLLVVDAAGRIRYRHAGSAAEPLPADDVVLQIEHLERRRAGSAAPAPNPTREVR